MTGALLFAHCNMDAWFYMGQNLLHKMCVRIIQFLYIFGKQTANIMPYIS